MKLGKNMCLLAGDEEQQQRELLASKLAYEYKNEIKKRYEVEDEIKVNGEWLRAKINEYLEIMKNAK